MLPCPSGPRRVRGRSRARSAGRGEEYGDIYEMMRKGGAAVVRVRPAQAAGAAAEAGGDAEDREWEAGLEARVRARIALVRAVPFPASPRPPPSLLPSPARVVPFHQWGRFVCGRGWRGGVGGLGGGGI